MRASAIIGLGAVLLVGSSDAANLSKRDWLNAIDRDRPIYFDLKKRAFLQPRADPKVIGLGIGATVRTGSSFFLLIL